MSIHPAPAGAVWPRRLIVLAAAVFMVATGQIQTVFQLGQSPEAFSADSDATLRVVGWAFAVWAPIYLGVILYAVRQALPATGESPMVKAFGWPSVLAFLGCGWWLVAAAVDAEVATVVLIFGSLIVLVIPLLRHADLIRSLGAKDRDRWLTAWPLAALAGWLTVAAPVNLLTIATGNGDLPTALPPLGWALLAVAVVAAVGLFMTWRTRLLAYPLPIAWGLLGVFTAEQERGAGVLAFSALAASLIVLGGALAIVFGLRLSHRAEAAASRADPVSPS